MKTKKADDKGFKLERLVREYLKLDSRRAS